MTNKELRRLGRRELLELLLALSQENDALTQQVAQLQKQLEERTIAVENSGTLAEASLKLNGVFQAAQDACDQYCENMKKKTQEECSAMLTQAMDLTQALTKALAEANTRRAEQG